MSLQEQASRILALRNNIRTKLIAINVISDTSATLQDCSTALNSTETFPKRDASDITKSAGVVYIPKGYYAQEVRVSMSEYIVSLPTQTGTLTYTGAALSPTWSNEYDSTKMDISGTTSGTDATTYTAVFTPKVGYHWSDGTRTALEQTWLIDPKSISGAAITLGAVLTYTGGVQAQTVNSVVIDSLSATYSVSGNIGTNAGSYTLTCTGTGNFSGTVDKSWSINKLSLAIPYLSGTSKTYNGGSQSPTVNDFNSTWETQTGDISATSVGSYTVYWNLKDTDNTQWSDGSITQKSGTWNMGPATITRFSLNTNSIDYNGSTRSVSVSSVTAGSMNATYSTSGTYSATNAGSYTAYVTGTGNFTGSLSAGWTINQIPPVYTAPVNASPTYNGSYQYIMTSGSVSGGTMYYYSGGSWSTSRPTALNAGAWDCYWRIDGDSNHTSIGSTYVRCNMNQRSIDTFNWTGDWQWYSGGNKSITATEVKGGGMNATYSTSGTWTASGVGTYTAYVTGTNNFCGTLSATWHIQYVWYKYYSNIAYYWINEAMNNVFVGTGNVVSHPSKFFKDPPTSQNVMEQQVGLYNEGDGATNADLYNNGIWQDYTFIHYKYLEDTLFKTGDFVNQGGYYMATGTAKTIGTTWVKGEYITAVGSMTRDYPDDGRAGDGYWYTKTW